MKKMDSCYLDANVLIGFFIANSVFHQRAKRVVKKLVKNRIKIYISSLCLDEYLYSVIKILRLNRIKVDFNFLKLELSKFLMEFNIQFANLPHEIEYHIKVIDMIAEYKLRPRDAYHLLYIDLNSIDSIATFDNDFNKVFENGFINRFE